HNPVYNASNTRQIGTDNGSCIRTVATGKTEWECTWTTLLPGGHLTVEGPFFDDGTNTTLAITGGTGRDAGAGGSMLLPAPGNPLGPEFYFIFTLTHSRDRLPPGAGWPGATEARRRAQASGQAAGTASLAPRVVLLIASHRLEAVITTADSRLAVTLEIYTHERPSGATRRLG